MTITSSKREKNKTKKKHKQKKAAKLHVSPGCQPTSRWGPPPPSPLLVFPVQESNPLQSPPSELRALVPRSLLRNRTEMLATHSRNRVLVCSGIIGRTDRAKIKQNKQTNKQKKTARTKRSLKEGLQGLIMDNTNLRSFQELASDFLANFFYNLRVNLLQILHLYMCCGSILSLV